MDVVARETHSPSVPTLRPPVCCVIECVHVCIQKTLGCRVHRKRQTCSCRENTCKGSVKLRKLKPYTRHACVSCSCRVPHLLPYWLSDSLLPCFDRRRPLAIVSMLTTQDNPGIRGAARPHCGFRNHYLLGSSMYELMFEVGSATFTQATGLYFHSGLLTSA